MKTYARVLVGIMLALLSVLSYAQAAVPFVNLPLVVVDEGISPASF
jgi:hypothetical protein